MNCQGAPSNMAKSGQSKGPFVGEISVSRGVRKLSTLKEISIDFVILYLYWKEIIYNYAILYMVA